MMRIFVTSAFLIAVFACVSLAQPAPKQKPLPCVDVQIGADNAPALNCLNQTLKSQVEHQQAAPNPQAPIDARSPSNQVGTFNNNAAREQMGNSYGVSATPQRPKSIYTSPLIAPAPR